VCLCVYFIVFCCSFLPLDKVVLGHGLARIMSVVYC
jgi:hypothetical protein